MAHVKTTDGYDVKVPNQGQVNLNTVLGAFGAYGTLSGMNGNCGNGLFGGLFGGRNNCGCSPMDTPVTRYEMAMQQEIASKDSKIALLEANTYQDQKSLELYKYVDSKFNSINEVLAAQAVRNQAINDSIQSLDYKTMQAIALEAERRQCADCKIVNYVNSTFAPKLVTDFAAGTTSAVAQVYNPLACGQCCGGGNTFAGPAV
jgi:hypothetical protein